MGEYVLPPDIVATLAGIDQQVGELALGPTPPWLFPVFENAWANVGGLPAPASYMRDGVGIVHLRGLITGGVSGKQCFTLPAGFRPGRNEFFAGTAGAGTFMEWGVSATGVVTPVGAKVAEYASLSGISFVAEK